MYTSLYVRQAVVVYKGNKMKNLLILTMLAVSLNVVASEGRDDRGGWSPTANIANTNTSVVAIWLVILIVNVILWHQLLLQMFIVA